MGNENGVWIMHGLSARDKKRLHTVEELIAYVKQIGFLPLFANEIKGFSVEERTVANYWWTDDIKNDPWAWRTIAGKTGEITYGKFFNKKTGYISKEWFPYFANYRRNGYDFDALWDDELASAREKKIMDLFDDSAELYSFEVKKKGGFYKGGEKNFEGTITGLQMHAFLCISDFRQKINKDGEGYGWHIAMYSTPERLWGYDYVSSAYKEAPEQSGERIFSHIKKLFPAATDKDLAKVLGI